MKHSIFTFLCIALIGCASPHKQEQNDSNMNNENNNELTAFDVQKEFQKNGFDWFTENLILCSGDTTESNAMNCGSLEDNPQDMEEKEDYRWNYKI